VVKASDIDLAKAFPLHAAFDFQQQDAAGKTVVAKNTFDAVITFGSGQPEIRSRQTGVYQ
jgi:hypothetical protein